MSLRLVAAVMAATMLVTGGCTVGGRPRPETATTAASRPQDGPFTGFEHGTTGWVAIGGGAIGRTRAYHRVGTYAMQVRLSTTARYPSPYGAYAPNVVANPSYDGTYRLAFWIRSNEAAAGATVAAYITESGGQLPAHQTAMRKLRLSPRWRYVSFGGRVRNRGRTFLSISIVQLNDVVASAAFYLDDPALRFVS